MTRRTDAPDVNEAVDQYRRHADGYDISAQRTMRMRRRTIDKLGLRRGDRVLDVASGTGLSFAMLRDAVGAEGEVIGIDVSPEMNEIARQRIAAADWQNVSVLESPIDSAHIPPPMDAILFNFTHDVMRSPQALARVFAAARPDARVAFAGMKYLPWWLAPFNAIVRAKARPYMTTLEGLDRPWNHALPYLSEFHWTPALFGIAYVAWGRVAPSDSRGLER